MAKRFLEDFSWVGLIIMLIMNMSPATGLTPSIVMAGQGKNDVRRVVYGN